MKKIITCLMLITANVCFAGDTKPILNEIQKVFQDAKTINTSFDQTVSSTRFGDKKTSGKLLIARPGKMIWTYQNPKGRVFAADGELITLYDPEDKQALVTQQPSGSKLPAGFSFLMGEADLEKLFQVEMKSDQKNTKGNREVVLLCKPKAADNGEFKTLELTFEWSPTLRLKSSKTKDLMDSENEIVFGPMKFNEKIGKDAFDVKLPKGTPVVTSNSM